MNKERKKAYGAARYQRIKEKVRAANATPEARARTKARKDAFYQKNKELLRAKSRARWWRRNGFISAPRSEPNTCECCGEDVLLLKRRLALDHDHETGAFRGWLCAACNLGLGMLGDDIGGVKLALAYLERALRAIK